MFYATDELKLQYNYLLNEAYNNLYKASLLSCDASLEIREQLNRSLWSQLTKIEHEIANTGPPEIHGAKSEASDDNHFHQETV